MNAGGRAYARLLGDGWRFPNGSGYWSGVVDQGLALRKASALGAAYLLVNFAAPEDTDHPWYSYNLQGDGCAFDTAYYWTIAACAPRKRGTR